MQLHEKWRKQEVKNLWSMHAMMSFNGQINGSILVTGRTGPNEEVGITGNA